MTRLRQLSILTIIAGTSFASAFALKQRSSAAATHTRSAVPASSPESVQLAAIGLVPGRQLVAYVLGSSRCRSCRSPETKAAIAKIRPLLRQRYGGEVRSVMVVGVAIHTDLREGLDYLQSIGLEHSIRSASGAGGRTSTSRTSSGGDTYPRHPRRRLSSFPARWLRRSTLCRSHTDPIRSWASSLDNARCSVGSMGMPHSGRRHQREPQRRGSCRRAAAERTPGSQGGDVKRTARCSPRQAGDDRGPPSTQHTSSTAHHNGANNDHATDWQDRLVAQPCTRLQRRRRWRPARNQCGTAARRSDPCTGGVDLFRDRSLPRRLRLVLLRPDDR
jgi:hypothetical protein